MPYISLTTQQITVIYACFVPVSGLLFLLTLIKKNHLFSRDQSVLFQKAAIVNLLLISLTTADFFLSTQSGEYAWLFRKLTSMSHFIMAPLMPYYLLRLYSQKKLKRGISIPLILNLVLCVSTLFYNTVFFISTSNGYIRGPLFFVPLVVSVFYVLLLISNPMTVHRQGKRQEMVYLLAIIGVVLLAMGLEISLHFVCMEYGACAIGLIMYYILQCIHYFSSDSLTGAYNRQMFNHLLENISKADHSIFALADINDFKTINDEQGHAAGDRALILFVSILTEAFEGIASVYRIGGDEFMIVSKKANMPNFLAALDKAREEAATHHLQFACGVAKHQHTDNAAEIINQVDKEMYLAKSRMKQHR